MIKAAEKDKEYEAARNLLADVEKTPTQQPPAAGQNILVMGDLVAQAQKELGDWEPTAPAGGGVIDVEAEDDGDAP